MRLKGDEGARKLIGALNEGELVEVEASDMGVTFDVDTPEDLAAAQRLGGGREIFRNEFMCVPVKRKRHDNGSRYENEPSDTIYRNIATNQGSHIFYANW